MLTNPLSKPNEALSSLDKPVLAISRLQLHVSFKEHLKYVCEYQGAVVAPWFGDRIGSVTTFKPLVRTYIFVSNHLHVPYSRRSEQPNSPGRVLDVSIRVSVLIHVSVLCNYEAHQPTVLSLHLHPSCILKKQMDADSLRCTVLSDTLFS